MHRLGIGGASILLATALVAFVPRGADAQMRRRAASPGDAPPAPSGPSYPRLPFAGSWEGTFTLQRGRGANQPMPLRVAFDVADSARNAYTGATILPNGGRAPHLSDVVTDGVLQWRQRNSGGGDWVYSARLVSRQHRGDGGPP